MSFELFTTRQFEKDMKKLALNRPKFIKLKNAIEILSQKGTLPFVPYKTHKLKGDYKDCLEAHIEPDLLIIWLIDDSVIRLIRCGSHAELF